MPGRKGTNAGYRLAVKRLSGSKETAASIGAIGAAKGAMVTSGDSGESAGKVGEGGGMGW